MDKLIANWNDYVLLANRTAKPLPYEQQRWHARLGLITEVGELADAYKRHQIYGKPLDLVNVREEIGDLCWYIALEFMTCELPKYNLDNNKNFAPESAQRILENLSRAITYTDKLPYDLIIRNLQALCVLEGIDFKQCLGLNIAKLAERYGDKYSDEAALIRNLQAERVTLTGA
jgi:hypothetical protein